MLHPADWTYVAEGGKHAVFAFSVAGSANNGSTHLFDGGSEGSCLGGFEGCVLRIAKSDMAGCALRDSKVEIMANFSRTTTILDTKNTVLTPSVSVEAHAQSCVKVEFHRRQKRILNYLGRIVASKLGRQYVDMPSWLHIPITFINELYLNTMRSGAIPKHRLQSWLVRDKVEESIDRDFVVATLLRDYTSLIVCHRCHCSQSVPKVVNTRASELFPTISVEIKPKAGYLSISPLVHPSRRCKFYHTRYEINQQLMASGQLRRGWGCVKKGDRDKGFSHYDPRDLFSGDQQRIRMALNNLMESMQNNLKVWHGGDILFGHGVDMIHERQMLQIANTLFPEARHSATSAKNKNSGASHAEDLLKEGITDVVSSVLAKEPLLTRLLALQRLDIIDTDGAIAIFDRLIDILGGNVGKAEKCLDHYCCNVTGDKCGGFQHETNDYGQQCSPVCSVMDSTLPEIGKVLTSSPYNCPECPALSGLLVEISSFRQNFGVSHDDKSFLDSSNCLARKYVNELSKEGCLFLLGNWLLSLGMCDTSFFVTFKRVNRPLSQPTFEAGVSWLQMNDEHGEVCLIAPSTSPQDCSTRAYTYGYDVKVVDCDPKPARKLCGRNRSEELVERFKSNKQQSV
eukprot:CAMPEP_0113530866 /NCGR_PEP_ID=MMETSP0015_2-20120614/3183_1 /TAXON_ID=2838 /ORGANISM="Odontella" /LENGTH=625 /DNA_ID=CAMNT_0000429647 /DNA_START=350 /DNA_END=2224 /DNA_ORIENTATION=+ /assembly_acc=CAM_ASM_000160